MYKKEKKVKAVHNFSFPSYCDFFFLPCSIFSHDHLHHYRRPPSPINISVRSSHLHHHRLLSSINIIAHGTSCHTHHHRGSLSSRSSLSTTNLTSQFDRDIRSPAAGNHYRRARSEREA